MKPRSNPYRYETLALALILVWAAALRLWDAGNFTFSHDELSALLRTGFSDWGKLIQNGVLPDFHPAGVQVFMNYYLQLFPDTPWVVRLPFIFCGLASIFMGYQIGKAWHSRSAGLLVAALMSTTQYFVQYSQLARPYAPGLLFVLIAVYGLSRFYNREKISWKHWLVWVLGAVATSYVHYYALITLVFFALAVIPLLRGRKLGMFLLSGLAIGMGHLPHLPILLQQVSKGGVGSWLGKPGPQFMSEFLAFLTQFFWPLQLVLILLVALSLRGIIRKPASPLIWAGLATFALSLLFGYIWSYQVSAILQKSGMLFSAPLLLIALFSGVELRHKSLFAVAGLVLVSGTAGLIYERQYYRHFYEMPIPTLAQKALAASDSLDAAILTSAPPEKWQFYQQDGRDVFFINDTSELQHIPLQRDWLLAIYDGNPMHTVEWLRQFYPCQKILHQSTQADLYHFSRKNCASDSFQTWHYQGDYRQPDRGDFRQVADVAQADTLLDHPYSYFCYSVALQSEEKLAKSALTATVYQNDSLVQWSSQPVRIFENNKQYRAYLTLRIPRRFLASDENLKLRFSFWKLDDTKVRTSAPRLELFRGNPWLYAQYEDLP